MTGHPLAAKQRIDEALEALRIGLTPYVTQRMESVFGDRWRSNTSRAAGDEDDFALDTYALLKTILDNWHDVFRTDARLRKARSYISLALDARNKMSHFVGAIEQREALRFLDAIIEVLRGIEANPQQEIVSKLYTEQQFGMTPIQHVTEPNTAQKSLNPPSPRVFHQPLAPIPKINAPVASSQTQADRIRQFAYDHYISSARQQGLAEITIRAGDVHRDMRLASAMPAVCSAIGSNKFAQMANVTLAERTGPAAGSNVYFRFALGARTPGVPLTTSTAGRPPETTPAAGREALKLDDALVLISCVKSKLARPAPARELYTSAWFRGVRDLVEASGARWLLLSSRYGLVPPDQVIAPYDYTLNTLGVVERQDWAKNVLAKLLPETVGFRRIVIFGGARYREFLIEPLQRRGMIVEVPFEHLRRGEQLEWLARHH